MQSQTARALALGNVVVPDVIAFNLQNQVLTLPVLRHSRTPNTARQLVVLSLFDGINGFLLGLDRAASTAGDVLLSLVLWTLLCYISCQSGDMRLIEKVPPFKGSSWLS